MKRRRFLTRVSGCGVAALAGVAESAIPSGAKAAVTTAKKPSRAIDTHTHFYDPERPEGVPWPREGTALFRTVLPDHWSEEAEPCGVGETVVVEASPWVEDNQWILDLAEEDARIVGLVGNLDPLGEDFAAQVRRFAPHPVFCGLRWRANLVDLGSERERLFDAARLMADHDLSLDLNGPPSILRGAVEVADTVPGLRIVINHLGGPGDPSAPSAEWSEVMGELSARPSVFMKVSGLVEQVRGEPGAAPAETDHYRPVLDAIWEFFGEDRVIFGSNWPVSDRGAPYATLYRIVEEYFAEKGEVALDKYFWRNSLDAYRWSG